MRKICWWTGTDALTLVRNPPGTLIWHTKLILYRIKWKILIRLFDEHWVNGIHLEKHLRKFGVKKKVLNKETELIYSAVKKINHKGFNILYYCPSTPNNLGGMRYINWVYGYDIFLQISKRIPEANIITVGGEVDMNEVYPIIDLYIRPTRHDGNPRMTRECEINDIPVIKSKNFNPDVNYFVNEIKKRIQEKGKYNL